MNANRKLSCHDCLFSKSKVKSLAACTTDEKFLLKNLIIIRDMIFLG